ncbi:Zinc finger, SWIM-type [uncultured Caudovirales phage]|uniref:Zinc finger, SWIM-type n=1 Tax=uncultured Caudovirales phage TaxID=2100421 RepID=A0A6J5M1E8_9CAUD|nr:Zinc finger, SWIM-type [uncultured Caudovirales phage]CAB4148093.1 Zinc finger, SWIM-type [uncultured Caudovirales phage]
MEIEWRTVQFFLDEEEFIIAEVSVDAMNSKKTRCSCLRFQKNARCKHAKFVQDKMAQSGGVFNLRIPAGVDDEAAMDALYDTELFRVLVLKYGKIEIL